MNVLRTLFCTLLLAGTAWSGLARAVDFPSQPLRIVVPFAPGGGTDVVARLLAERLTPVLGQQVTVDNRPGGNSVIATRAVAAAAADGHTLLLTTDIHAINAAYAANLPYDTLRDFAPITQLTSSPLLLLAHPSAGVRTLPELVAAAKARPGGFSFGSLGTSSPHHLGFAWFKTMTGIDIVDVPYKGGGQALVDLLGGQIHLSLVVAGNGIKQARAGKAIALAVTSPVRHATAPEVPTVAESGWPEFAIVNWYALFAPAGTPAAAISRLATEIATILREPPVIERLAATGLDAAPGTPAALDALVRRDVDRYRRIIALTGAKPE